MTGVFQLTGGVSGVRWCYVILVDASLSFFVTFSFVADLLTFNGSVHF